MVIGGSVCGRFEGLAGTCGKRQKHTKNDDFFSEFASRSAGSTQTQIKRPRSCPDHNRVPENRRGPADFEVTILSRWNVAIFARAPGAHMLYLLKKIEGLGRIIETEKGALSGWNARTAMNPRMCTGNSAARVDSVQIEERSSPAAARPQRPLGKGVAGTPITCYALSLPAARANSHRLSGL